MAVPEANGHAEDVEVEDVDVLDGPKKGKSKSQKRRDKKKIAKATGKPKSEQEPVRLQEEVQEVSKSRQIKFEAMC